MHDRYYRRGRSATDDPADDDADALGEVDALAVRVGQEHGRQESELDHAAAIVVVLEWSAARGRVSESSRLFLHLFLCCLPGLGNPPPPHWLPACLAQVTSHSSAQAHTGHHRELLVHDCHAGSNSR